MNGYSDAFYDGVIIEKRRDIINGYKSFFENAADGLFRSSLEGRFTLANQSMANLWGCDTPEEMMESITDIKTQCYFHPDDRQKIINIILKKGFVRDYAFLAKKQDGSTFWCQMSVIAVRDEEGNIKYFEGSNRDITERMKKEEELNTHKIQLEMQNEELQRSHEELSQSQIRYFDLYDLAPIGYCTLDNKGKIIESNLTTATMLGMDRESLIGNYIHTFICKEYQDIYYIHHKKLFETKESQTYEMRVASKKRNPFWVQVESSLSQNNEQIMWFVMIDITIQVEEHNKRVEAENNLQNIYEEARIRMELIDSKAEESMMKFNNSILKSIQTMRERRLERA